MADADDLKVDDVEEQPEPGAAGDGGPEQAPPAYGGAASEQPPADAPGSRPQSGAAAGSPPSSARARASAKVHPEPEPEPARSDPEKGAAAEPADPPPEWAERWLSNQNKADKMNAFRQYIERVQDQAEGPVPSPSAEERHASAYWVTNRFLLDRCSAHGVPHIMRHPSRWRRLFWALVVVGALVALVVQVRATLSEYLRYPKKVTIEILEDSTPEFPSVTICNFNILSSDKMSELDKYRDIVSLEQDIADQGMDCGEYISEFDGYYSKNDAYEYDYMWMYEDGMVPEYGSGMVPEYGSGSGMVPEYGSGMVPEYGSGSGDPYSTYDTTDGYGDGTEGTYEATGGAESTFYDASTPPFDATASDSTDVPDGGASEGAATPTAAPGAEDPAGPTADPAAGSGTDGPAPSGAGKDATQPNVEEQSLRRKREARVSQSDPRRSPAAGAGGGVPRLRPLTEPEVPGARRRLVLVRRRRSADTTEVPGAWAQPEMYEDYNFDSSNYSITYFDPSCKCQMTCNQYGCYQEDSVFNQLGNNKSFRELVQSLRRTHGDPSVMQRAFTPSVEEIQQYGIKSAQFITACTLDDAKCSHQDFYQWQSDGYGNCFTFNSGFRYAWNQATGKLEHVKPNKTRTFGSKAGLRVTLNVDAGHYSSLLTPDVGVRVVVHPTDQLPFPEERGFSVVPGFTTAVGISRKRIHRVGPPHGVCREFAEFFGGRELRYTTTACQKRCVEHAIRTQCQCMESVNRDLTMGLTRGLARCNPLVNSTADRCRQQVKSQFSRGKSTCDCPPACLEDRYEKALSMSLPNKHYYRIMRNFTEEFTGTDLCESDNISNSTIRLQVYLEDPSYEYIHESPAYSVESLVSNIGGVMGICLGLSALTLVEMAEYLVELTVSGWSNWRNRGERAAARSGIKRVEVLPSDQSTGMQYIRVVHRFDVRPETVVKPWVPPRLADAAVSTLVSLPTDRVNDRAWMKP